MSYDLCLDDGSKAPCFACGGSGAGSNAGQCWWCEGTGETPHPRCHLNVTYNLSRMFHRAVREAGTPDDENRGIRTIYGMTGAEARRLVTKMVHVMEQDPTGYRALEPENRWGTYESCLQFLRSVIAASHEHPLAKWEGD